ncbi:hypothetical protein AaE_013661 [Aphanomyces astaci]|uniref:tRNA N(3)-methylcytidine methyltransferase n=1 Tax=Aphanomyces astaci TaxID=112090 RepID=A0A6A4Z6B9_APHAT|nr:hypothetical protein AaE_013661 [Aphanomyces astaci]
MRPAGSFHAHDFEWEELAVTCRAQLAAAGNASAKNEDESDVASGAATVEEEVHTGDELGVLAQGYWDVFHAKNNGKVYKPRNYLSKEFPDLLVSLLQTARNVLEVGCGYGSAIFPLLAESPSMHAHVFDFSPHAITILKANPLYDAARCCAYVCDLVADADLGVPDASMDVVLMVFVLSAIPPTSFANVMHKVHRALKPGGVVCFRDYGLYDLAMMRSTKKVHATTRHVDHVDGKRGDGGDKHVYYRGDGTLATFFSIQDLSSLFEGGGFDVVENEYCTVRLRNRRTQTNMDRVWVHGKFVKR